MAYPISKLWIYTLCRVLTRNIEGINNIPKDFNFILISNHDKLIDPLLILYPILENWTKKFIFLQHRHGGF